LPGKLLNLAAQDYPADRLEVIVISDGSTDETNKILGAWQNSGRRAVILSEHQGKANALNHGTAEAKGEIICFTDTRQTIALDALKNLVANFADPSVGCVSGDITLGDPATGAAMNGLGIYWQLESNMRRWEGAAGSLIGAAGCLYAVRKDLVVPFPEGTILDDVYLPLHVARQGKRVVFESQAQGWDDPQHDRRREFRRKVRTLTGNYQLLQLAPWLLTRKNPVRFEFVCHKILRLAAPFAFAGVLLSSFLLQGLIYRTACAIQVFCYTLAILAVLRARLGMVSRMADVSLAFLVLNAAAIVALLYFVMGKKAAWAR
jgi:biofilm PGA synthesis N-glycosyltransferase PgaC